jgi:hypothetical protein
VTLTLDSGLRSGDDQVRHWNPVLSSRAPGFAAALPIVGGLRLIVLDVSDRRLPRTALTAAMGRQMVDGSADALADRLVGSRFGRSRCSSVAIADLSRHGVLDLQLRNAPSAVLLSPQHPARLLPGAVAGSEPYHVGTGEVLILCSASFLEDPPAALGTVRQSPAGDDGLARLRRALRVAPHPGASASVVRVG